MNMIEVFDLTKEFNALRAVDAVSFDVIKEMPSLADTASRRTL